MSGTLVNKPRKRIFFGLSLVGLLGLAFIAAVGLFLINPRLAQLSPIALPLTAGLAALLLLYLGAGLLLAALSTHRKSHRDSGVGRRRWTTARWMLPMATGLGRLFGYQGVWSGNPPGATGEFAAVSAPRCWRSGSS